MAAEEGEGLGFLKKGRIASPFLIKPLPKEGPDEKQGDDREGVDVIAPDGGLSDEHHPKVLKRVDRPIWIVGGGACQHEGEEDKGEPDGQVIGFVLKEMLLYRVKQMGDEKAIEHPEIYVHRGIVRVIAEEEEGDLDDPGEKEKQAGPLPVVSREGAADAAKKAEDPDEDDVPGVAPRGGLDGKPEVI